jgi:hypothetical protein
MGKAMTAGAIARATLFTALIFAFVHVVEGGRQDATALAIVLVFVMTYALVRAP